MTVSTNFMQNVKQRIPCIIIYASQFSDLFWQKKSAHYTQVNKVNQ